MKNMQNKCPILLNHPNTINNFYLHQFDGLLSIQINNLYEYIYVLQKYSHIFVNNTYII
jgi:hypothetical protein